MEASNVVSLLQDAINQALNDKYGVDEAQILPEGSLALLLDDGTLIRVKLDVQVQATSQEAKTEIMKPWEVYALPGHNLDRDKLWDLWGEHLHQCSKCDTWLQLRGFQSHKDHCCDVGSKLWEQATSPEIK